MLLTDTAIRNAKSAERQYKLGDEKGLFLLIHPNGSKYWRLKYRPFHEKTPSLGGDGGRLGHRAGRLHHGRKGDDAVSVDQSQHDPVV
ncbi:MAG: hypothetical protein B7X46_07520 [Thiomonas sp. 15-66-11]|nr:MAG: hypothetical protein B7X46_07520 [Thiomonas sp. 15-66-11]